MNDQLRAHGMTVTVGAIVVASLTESPYSPTGGSRTEDVRAEAVYHATMQQTHPNVDHEARWGKKRNKTIYGYKKHVATD